MKKLIGMKGFLTVAVAVVMLLVLVTGCAQKVAPQKILKVGMELAYPPFETKDSQGNASGVSVDLAKALGESLGMQVQIENTAWDGLIPSLQTGKVDVVISSMTITEKRKEMVDFSDSYAKAYLALLVNKKSNITTVEDLNKAGRTVAVKQGSTGDTYARANFANATINAFASESACVTEVTQGKADAFIYDQLTIYRNSVQYKDTTAAVFIPLQKDAESWGMAFKKGSDLKAKADAFLKDFTAKGGFDKLTDSYLKDEKAMFATLGFSFFFPDTNGNWPQGK